jgi:hypothetical protein
MVQEDRGSMQEGKLFVQLQSAMMGAYTMLADAVQDGRYMYECVLQGEISL